MPHLTAEMIITAEHLSEVMRGGIRTVYQPIIDLGRLEIAGYEALTRFDHPEVVAGPDRWFAAATELGALDAFEAATLRSAFAARPSLPPGRFLTVNLEPASLTAPRVRRVIQQQKNLTGVVIEITEHAVYDIEDVAPALAQIRRSGAQLAMDDAGSGHSGLQQILTLRPEVLKLDRALVEGVDDDEARMTMVDMLRSLSTRLGSKLLAEGVETRAEAAQLCHLGVPLAQGYYFGRPGAPFSEMPEDVHEALWNERFQFDSDNLQRLCVPYEALPARAPDLADRLAATGRRYSALVDGLGRPVGLGDALDWRGEPSSALIVSATTRPAELASRLSTNSADLCRPVIVTDNGGHYLGLLHIRRLLGDLGERGPSASTPS